MPTNLHSDPSCGLGPLRPTFKTPKRVQFFGCYHRSLSLCVSFSHSHSHFHTLPYLWNSETQTPHVCVINKLMLIVPLKFLSPVRLRYSKSSTFQTSIIFLRTVSCQSSQLSQHIFCLQLLHSPYTNKNSCSAMLINSSFPYKSSKSMGQTVPCMLLNGDEIHKNVNVSALKFHPFIFSIYLKKRAAFQIVSALNSFNLITTGNEEYVLYNFLNLNQNMIFLITFHKFLYGN